MSERKDEHRPELTPSESPDRYLEEIVRRHAEAAVRSEPPPRRRWRVPVVLASLAVLAGLTAWNVVRVAREPEVFTPVEEEAGLNFTIYLVAEGIEAYRGSSGALPENLVVLGLDDEGVDYVVRDSGYVLVATQDTVRVTYRSGDDLTAFANAYELLVGEAER